MRIPHHMVGNGWIYLGEYHFNAGANTALGSVVVSNLRGSAAGTYTFADAIRFGNGMGSVDRGGGVSGYPREEENCRYWIQANFGQGQDPVIYDASTGDENDSWQAPGRMSAEMNREEEGSIYKRIHISFHSNAGGRRGTLALITSDPTPNQATLAQIVGNEVDEDLVARTNSFGSTNVTFYFRRQFHVPSPLAVQSLTARLIRDDGAVIYLNGSEIWRDSMPAGSVLYSTPASATISGADETTWLTLNPQLSISSSPAGTPSPPRFIK